MRINGRLIFSLILAFPLFLWFVSFLSAQTVGVMVKWRAAQCGDSGDNDGDFLIDFSADDQCSSTIDDDENVTGTETHATQDFTVSGGTFSFTNADGLAVDFSFPANFYTEAVRLFANSYANNFFAASKPAPSGKSFIGKTYDFLLYVVSDGSSLASPNKAITITLRYNDSDASSVSEGTIAAYVWRSSDTSWQAISGSAVDTSNNAVTFSTASFGSFALFGSVAAAAEEAAPKEISRGGDFVREFLKKLKFIPFFKKPPPPPPPPPLPPPCPDIDFNCDGRVNLQDLSIMLFYWDKPQRPYDINGDGRIDLQDVSILLYYWSE